MSALAIAGGVCVVAAVVGVIVLRRGGKSAKSLPEAGPPEAPVDLERRARQALADGDLEAARELYLEAHKPVHAAQVAVRQGKLELAGELFERAGQLGKAAAAYRKAGLERRATAIEAQSAKKDLAASPGAIEPSLFAAQQVPSAVPEALPALVPEALPALVPEALPALVPETLPALVPETLPALVPEALPASACADQVVVPSLPPEAARSETPSFGPTSDALLLLPDVSSAARSAVPPGRDRSREDDPRGSVEKVSLPRGRRVPAAAIGPLGMGPSSPARSTYAERAEAPRPAAPSPSSRDLPRATRGRPAADAKRPVRIVEEMRAPRSRKDKR